MTLHALREYRFETTAQWRAGLASNWIESANGLRAPSALRASIVASSSAKDANAAVAFDPGGGLAWIRQRTFELVRLREHDSIVVDALRITLDPKAWSPRGMVFGASLIWVLFVSEERGTRLIGVGANTLCEVVASDPSWQIVSIAPGPQDALWAIATRDGHYHLVSVSVRGNVRSLLRIDGDADDKPVPDVKGASLASIPGTHCVAILTHYDPAPCSRDCRLWRVSVVDLACAPIVDAGDVTEIFRTGRKPIPCREDSPAFVPDTITVECGQTIYVVSRASGETMALSRRGETCGRWREIFSHCQLPLNDIAAQHELLASGSAGVYKVEAVPTSVPAADDSASLYLTPALVSPDGIERGWSRLDLDVRFGGRSQLEIRVAHTNDVRLIEQETALQQDATLAGGERLKRVTALLPWDPERTTTFMADEWPADRLLRLPLHEIESTHLWLMVTLRPDNSAPPAVLHSLRVRYPNLSYATYLPAVFQEDETGAAHLRNVLSVLEGVYGDIDEVLAELPANIDPTTAPAEWLPYLLRWLGLPVAMELSEIRQRRLLTEAPELLEWRGTLAGLEHLLELLVDGTFQVVDLAAGPAPWVLPTAGRRHYGQRLGCDTLVLCVSQPGFTPGENATLGSVVLGYTSLHTGELFAERNGLLRIVIALSDDNMAATEALLTRFLPYFVPAHCRYELRFVDQDRLPPPTLLTSSTELRTSGAARIGRSLVLGDSRLTGGGRSDTGITILDSNTVMYSGDYLT